MPLAKFNRYSYGKVARFMQKLDAVGVLDNMLIYASSDMGNPALHSTRNVPTVLAGGAAGTKFRMGRRLKMPPDCQTNLWCSPGDAKFKASTNNHLLVSIAQAFGLTDVNSFGTQSTAAGTPARCPACCRFVAPGRSGFYSGAARRSRNGVLSLRRLPAELSVLGCGCRVFGGRAFAVVALQDEPEDREPAGPLHRATRSAPSACRPVHPIVSIGFRTGPGSEDSTTSPRTKSQRGGCRSDRTPTRAERRPAIETDKTLQTQARRRQRATAAASATTAKPATMPDR